MVGISKLFKARFPNWRLYETTWRYKAIKGWNQASKHIAYIWLTYQPKELQRWLQSLGAPNTATNLSGDEVSQDAQTESASV